MFWFGGFCGAPSSRRLPLNSDKLWSDIEDFWLVGPRPNKMVQTSQTGRRSIAIIGPCGVSSSELARLATHGVPDDVAGYWPGSYVVVQVSDGETTVWTDFGGACPLYTLQVDGGVFWASSSRALAALTAHQIDTQRLAVGLLAPGVPALLDRRSVFAEVSLIPAAHRAVLSAAGRVTLRRSWRPQARSGDPVLRLRAELSAAVALRVDAATAPTVDLSGGVDSTALALLAAERLHPARSITGVTVHPAGVTSEGDTAYACEAARHPGIEHQLMPLGSEHAPYGGLDAVPATDEPAPSTIAHARFSAQLQWMRDQFNSDCHLTGDGGDSLLCTGPIMLADLIAGRHYRRALSEAVAWARLRRVSLWPLLVTAGRTAQSSRSAALHALADAWRTHMPSESRLPSNSGTGWFPTSSRPAWSTREARELAATAATSSADRFDPVPAANFTAFVNAEAMADVGRTARADAQMAEVCGVPLHNPFVDSRVIDAYLSIPLEARPGPAQYKPILRQAMADLFPTALARRTTKGSFTSDFYHGMRANLADLHAMADGHLAVLGLVNPSRFRQTLTLAAAGLPDAFASVEPVIMAEVWLRAVHDSPPILWTPIPGNLGAM